MKVQPEYRAEPNEPEGPPKRGYVFTRNGGRRLNSVVGEMGGGKLWFRPMRERRPGTTPVDGVLTMAELVRP